MESDSVQSRTLERRLDQLGGNVTVESCIPACQSLSYTIAGLEYAQECCKSPIFIYDGVNGTDWCSRVVRVR